MKIEIKIDGKKIPTNPFVALFIINAINDLRKGNGKVLAGAILERNEE